MNEADFLQVNVHALGKYEFCPRAGVLAFEGGFSDEKNDEETPRLDYLPLFDIELMNQAMKTANEQELKSGLIFLALCMGVLFFGSVLSSSLICLLVLLLLVIGRKTYLHWIDYRELSDRLKVAAGADVSNLGDPAAGRRQINWWGLTKGVDFQPVEPKGSYVHRELLLAGKPAKMVTHGGSRIPVIFYHGELAIEKTYHITRLSAYALLIEKNQKSDGVKWGIILDPSSMKGLAVPIGEKEKQAAVDTLHEFRLELIETRNGTNPVEPKSTSCANCPHGRPQKHIPGKTDTFKHGNKIPPRLTRGANGRSTHSACGDRFDWIPPHNLAIELGLREA